jgi:hypothetical protein
LCSGRSVCACLQWMWANDMNRRGPTVHDIASQGAVFRCEVCRRERPLGDVESASEDYPVCCDRPMVYALPAVRRAIEPQADA